MQSAPFARNELERLSATLARFLTHTTRSSIALTGDVAIQMHCHDAGVSSGRTQIADVDFVATSLRAAVRSVAVQRVRVLRAHSILVHKVQGMSGASTARPIDEKHSRDAMILGTICGRRIDPLPPDSVTRGVFGMDLTPCPRCEVSRTPGFTVAPRRRIVEILGYS